jgi:hypothetical protein
MADDPILPAKEAEPEDPMLLAGVSFPGNAEEEMAECFVEEYILQGFGDADLLRLFTAPFFAGTHAVYRARGEAYVKDLIARVRARWGHLRFRTVDAPACPSEEVNRA